MAKVALCWELGESKGHMSILAEYVQPLKQQGHDICLFVKDVESAREIAEFSGLDIYQAPVLKQVSQRYICVSYSSVLLISGYDDPDRLSYAIKEWRSAFSEHDVDFVIAEHSPLAILTAKITSISHAMTGSGFMIPPIGGVMPSIRLWEKIDNSLLVQTDTLLLQCLHKALDILGIDKSAYKSVGDIFSDASQWVIGTVELDHYGERGVDYLDKRSLVLFEGEEPVWPQEGKEKVFMYLPSTNSHWVKILNKLKGSSFSVLAVVPGMDDKDIAEISCDNVKLQKNYVDTNAVVKQCNLIVCHAGYSTVEGFLKQGIPSLLIPIHFESTMFSFRLGMQKLGFSANPVNPEIDILSMLEVMKNAEHTWQHAQQYSKKYQNKSSGLSIADVIKKHIN